jgi:hypothetical protein
MSTSRIPCPVHGGGDANCAVWRDERGRLHAKCWSYDCEPRAILAALGENPRNIFVSFVRLEIARKNLQAVHCGRRVLILHEELLRYLAAGTEPRR